MPEGENVKVTPTTAGGVGIVETFTVAGSLSIWIPWARVAKTQMQRAKAAREDLHAARTDPDTTKQSQALDDEGEAALVAICAATFAVEAVANAVSELVMPKETFDKWKSGGGRPAKASARLPETLKAAIADHRLAVNLAHRWKPLIDIRNAAVHFYAELRPLMPHPSGHPIDAHSAVHNQENAQAAVALLRETLVAVREAPRPKAASWGAAQAHLIDELDR